MKFNKIKVNVRVCTGFRQQYLFVIALIMLSGGVVAQSSTPGQIPKTQEEKIVFKTEDEAKAFVAENLKKPIPPDYQIPSYITSELPRAQVFDTLKVRYPEFYGKEKEEYLKAIMADPETYLKLSLESKAIRRYYDPSSKY